MNSDEIVMRCKKEDAWARVEPYLSSEAYAAMENFSDEVKEMVGDLQKSFAESYAAYLKESKEPIGAASLMAHVEEELCKRAVGSGFSFDAAEVLLDPNLEEAVELAAELWVESGQRGVLYGLLKEPEDEGQSLAGRLAAVGMAGAATLAGGVLVGGCSDPSPVDNSELYERLEGVPLSVEVFSARFNPELATVLETEGGKILCQGLSYCMDRGNVAAAAAVIGSEVADGDDEAVIIYRLKNNDQSCKIRSIRANGIEVDLAGGQNDVDCYERMAKK